ncbi:MAG: N-acetylmuramoyl-L-alanine amidase [Chthoniobacteraceae bacterium]
MKIGEDHFIEGLRRDLLPGGAAMPIRRVLVIHFTSGASAQSSIDYWRARGDGVCAHVIIDRDGKITQCRPFNRQCGHAGVSRWRDPVHGGKLYVGVNAIGIGIELANAGDDEALAKRWTKLPPVSAKHRNGGPLQKWEAYPEPQLISVTALAMALVLRYRLDDITGHDCIAPERKNDPGPAFPMGALRKACGFTGLPAVHKKP